MECMIWKTIPLTKIPTVGSTTNQIDTPTYVRQPPNSQKFQVDLPLHTVDGSEIR